MRLFNSAPLEVVAIVPTEVEKTARDFKQLFIFSENPRLSYVKVLNKFFPEPFVPGIAKTAIINSDKEIHENVRIGEYTIISGSVQIGEGTEIRDHVVITGSVTIGKNVRIKSGTVIGQKGFNFVYDENNIPLEFRHFGRVIIGDNVEIGALNTIAQGTLNDTVISDFVKTDDQVHIAHNVKIGYGTLITACSEISGSVTIGSNTWLGPNCSIIDRIAIGDNVLVGLGAVVRKSLPDNVLVAGMSAKVIRKPDEAS